MVSWGEGGLVWLLIRGVIGSVMLMRIMILRGKV